MAQRRLQREAREFARNPPDGVRAAPVGDDLFFWEACIAGPKDTPYEGGEFKLRLLVPQDYPYRPPRVTFLTKVYHTNINDRGNICLDVLMSEAWDGDSWSPAMNLAKVLLSITVLLANPNPDHPLCPDIGRQFRSNRAEHDRIAREWTKEHAKPAGEEEEEPKAEEVAAGSGQAAAGAGQAADMPQQQQELQQQHNGEQAKDQGEQRDATVTEEKETTAATSAEGITDQAARLSFVAKNATAAAAAMPEVAGVATTNVATTAVTTAATRLHGAGTLGSIIAPGTTTPAQTPRSERPNAVAAAEVGAPRMSSV